MLTANIDTKMLTLKYRCQNVDTKIYTPKC